MTTKAGHIYTITTDIDHAGLDFNPDTPEPLPDSMFQYPVFEQILHILGSYLDTLGDPATIFRSSNTFICYNPNNLNVRVSPDFYVAFDVDAPAIMERLLYLPWEAGKPPDFVLEVLSETTWQVDNGPKRDIYDQIGVTEYWRFDPTGGDYGEPLIGEQLVNGEYRCVSLTTEPDGVVKGYSPLLKLCLCWQDGMLTFYNPATREYLRNLPETQAALQQAETRIRQLEEELRSRE